MTPTNLAVLKYQMTAANVTVVKQDKIKGSPIIPFWARVTVGNGKNLWKKMEMKLGKQVI